MDNQLISEQATEGMVASFAQEKIQSVHGVINALYRFCRADRTVPAPSQSVGGVVDRSKYAGVASHTSTVQAVRSALTKGYLPNYRTVSTPAIDQQKTEAQHNVRTEIDLHLICPVGFSDIVSPVSQNSLDILAQWLPPGGETVNIILHPIDTSAVYEQLRGGPSYEEFMAHAKSIALPPDLSIAKRNQMLKGLVRGELRNSPSVDYKALGERLGISTLPQDLEVLARQLSVASTDRFPLVACIGPANQFDSREEFRSSSVGQWFVAPEDNVEGVLKDRSKDSIPMLMFWRDGKMTLNGIQKD